MSLSVFSSGSVTSVSSSLDSGLSAQFLFPLLIWFLRFCMLLYLIQQKGSQELLTEEGSEWWGGSVTTED